MELIKYRTKLQQLCKMPVQQVDYSSFTSLQTPDYFLSCVGNFSVYARRALFDIIQRLIQISEKGINGDFCPANKYVIRSAQEVRLDFNLTQMTDLEHNRYQDYIKGLRELASIEVVYQKGSDTKYTHVVNTILVDDNTTDLAVFVPVETAVDLIAFVNYGYTVYLKEIAKSLVSPYECGLYLLACQYRNSNSIPLFTINELKRYLNIPAMKYRQYRYFYQDILKPAIEEIYKRCDCFINIGELDIVKGEPTKLLFCVWDRNKTEDERGDGYKKWKIIILSWLTKYDIQGISVDMIEKDFFKQEELFKIYKSLQKIEVSSLELDEMREYMKAALNNCIEESITNYK